MKVKSRTDVITNSSSESFVLKSDDFREFKKYVETLTDEGEKKAIEECFKYFIVLDSFEDIHGENVNLRWWPTRLMGPCPHSPSTAYRSNPMILKVLKDFGHTVEEYSTYLKNLDREFWEKVEEKQESLFGVLYGKAFAELSLPNTLGEVMDKWMKDNNKSYIVRHYD